MLAGAGIAAAQTGNAASGGCTQSPENPTAVLGLLGAGGFAAAAFRNKVSALFTKRNR